MQQGIHKTLFLGMFTLVNGMIVFKDKEHIFIVVVKDIKVHSIKVRRMDKEFIGISMDLNMKEDGLMIKKMDLVNLDIQMEIFMKEIGSRDKNKVKVH